MQVLLRIANGKSNVRKVRIQADTIIGRSPECQLKVASNQISRRHCQISLQETAVSIRDLGSANGTFVNGRRIPPEVDVPLSPGTRIMLGPLQFTVEYDLPGSSAIQRDQADVQGTVETVSIASQDSIAAPVLQRPGLPPADAMGQVCEQLVRDVEVPLALPLRPRGGPSDPSDTSLSDTALLNQLKAGISSADDATPVPSGNPNRAVDLAQAMNSQPDPALKVARVVSAPVTPGVAASVPPEPFPKGETDFNFGIFAASGSGIVVESAPEIPSLQPPATSGDRIPHAKSGKKSFFQMLGWGRKDAADSADSDRTIPNFQLPVNDIVLEVQDDQGETPFGNRSPKPPQ